MWDVQALQKMDPHWRQCCAHEDVRWVSYCSCEVGYSRVCAQRWRSGHFEVVEWTRGRVGCLCTSAYCV